MTTDSLQPKRRSSTGRAAFAVIAAAMFLVIAGCTTARDAVPDTTVVGVGDSASSTTAPATSTTEVNPSKLLMAALERYGDGYQFESVVEVGDEQAVSVTGAVVGASAEMKVVSGDGVATYVTTPDASWVQVEGGEWQELESQGPFAPPLEALASPTSVTIIDSNTDGVAIVGLYDGTNFTSNGTVELKILVKDGLLVRVAYTTENATVRTSFGPLDGATIQTPAPTG